MDDSRLKALFAAVMQMPVAVMIVEAPSGRILLTNAHVRKVWRRDPQDGDLEEITRRALGGEVVDGEDLDVERGDGTMGVVRVSAAPVYDDDGTMLAAVVTVYDVTHERREQKALALLADASEVFGDVLEHEQTIHRLAGVAVPQFADFAFVHLIAPDGSVVRHEAAAADPAAFETIRPKWRGAVSDGPVKQVIATGQPIFAPNVTEDNWSFLSDPKEREVALSLGIRSAMMVPIPGAQRAYGAMAFARTAASRPYTRFDILIAEELARRAAQAVERSRLYESERQARQSAEGASRAKDEFLAILSHELRTPLTTVIGWADLLKMTYHGDDEAVLQAVDGMRVSAGVLARLIDDLLDVSRIVAGKLKIERKRVDLAAVIRAAAETLRVTAENKGLKLIVKDSPPILADADPARVTQIVTNLVTNAMKFTPPGGEVDVEVARRDGTAALVVSDTGVGIAPDFLPHVFERFRQASSGDSRTYTGLGLGLSIVQHVARLHGGEVKAESEGIGKGARFTVTLPVAESTAQPAPAPASASA